MGQLTYRYPTKQPINKKVHVGVIGLGNLEILMFPTEKKGSTVKTCTGSDDFGEVWNSILTRFLGHYPISTGIVVSDFGATPGVVYLRLMQAMEELSDEEQFRRIKCQRTSERST